MNKMLSFYVAMLCAISLCCHADNELLTHNLSYRRFTTLNGLPQMQTEMVWQDSRGYIYIGTLSGFVRYDGQRLTPFLRGQRENIVGFQEVGGEVRAMGFVRQWSISGDDVAKVPIDPAGNLLLNNFNSADLPPGYVLLEDRQEQNRCLCQVTATGMKRLMASPLLDEMTPDRKMFLDIANVPSPTQSLSAQIYVPTPQGVYRLEEGQVAALLTAKTDVFSLIRTTDGLFALAADGLYRVERDSISMLSEHHFDAPDYGLYVRQNRQGQLIVADSHTIWLYDAGQWQQLATGFNMIKGLCIDKWNRLWAATYQGAYCFFHCNFVNHRLTDDNDIVRAMTVDGQGQMVMGTLNGKTFLDGRLISNQPDNYFVPGTAVVGGLVYMAGKGDVAVVEGDRLAWLGLPYDKYQFVAAQGAQLIIGTRERVLTYQPESGRLDTLTSEIFHPWCAADDGEGRLWVAGNPGLFCLEEGIVRKVLSTPTSQIVTALSSDRKGRVYFAISDSLFTISGHEPQTVQEALPMLAGHEIRALHVSPRGLLVVAATDGLMVARIGEDRHLTDRQWFSAENGFTMIEPLKAPMAETADGTVWLAGLEEMTSFRPEELLADNHEPTIVEQPQPWWQRWWAIAIGLALLTALVWWIALSFEKRRNLKELLVLDREKEQVRMLLQQKELQLSAIRLKGIPHFHSNVLAGIEYFMMNNSPDKATHYLKLYSDFTNQTLTDIDRPARNIAEEVDFVRTYLQLEQLRYGERLTYHISVTDNVDRQTLLPTMLLYTYCQNAVKHGISAKPDGGHVEVVVCEQLRDGVSGVLVSVTDDGIGRMAAESNSRESTKQGLRILLEQTELYNQANRHKIIQQVTDLTDSNGRPAGTRFEMWVPSDYHFNVETQEE